MTWLRDLHLALHHHPRLLSQVEAPYREAGVLPPPPPPVPGSAEKPEKPEKASGSKGDTEKVNYSWKAI